MWYYYLQPLIKPSIVSKVYHIQKKHLRTKFSETTWQKLKQFFDTKQQPAETLFAMLDEIPPEHHVPLLHLATGWDIDKLLILQSLNVELPEDHIIHKLFFDPQNPLELTPADILSIENEDLEYLAQFYKDVPKEDILKLLEWLDKINFKHSFVRVVLHHVINTNFKTTDLLMATLAVVYFRFTKKILWLQNGKLTGYNVSEFIKEVEVCH